MGVHVLGVVVALLLVLQPAPRTQVAADLGVAATTREVADGAPAAAAALLPAILPEAASRTPAPDDAKRGQRRRHDRHGARHHRKEAADGARPGDHQARRHDRQDRQDGERKKKRHHRHGGMDRAAEDRHKNHGGNKKNNKNNKTEKNVIKNNIKNKTLDQPIRHRKQRQSRKKGGRRKSSRNNETVASSSPAAANAANGTNGTAFPFRRRSEEKQELVGRRTLEVLSPRGSPRAPPTSPALVGILDIPVQESSATAAPAAAVAVVTAPAASFKHAAKPGGGPAPGRRRVGSGAASAAAERKPIDPEWLQRLLAAAALASSKTPSASLAGQDESPCDRWAACSAKLLPAIRTQLAALPACPCTFPANVFYYNKIWDHKHARYFRWRDASGRAERLDVYHPDASYCIRSLHTAATGMLAAQHCCYDRNRQLLTRGSGAGTPALVSPDVSAALHDVLDVRPWRACKGDFTRYNALRPPNNDNQCAANPDEAEFQRQTELSQFY